MVRSLRAHAQFIQGDAALCWKCLVLLLAFFSLLSPIFLQLVCTFQYISTLQH